MTSAGIKPVLPDPLLRLLTLESAMVSPGLALFNRSWPMLITPLIAYAIFRRLDHREDEYLEQRFGQAYLDYRRRVNEVIPIPRFWQKGG